MDGLVKKIGKSDTRAQDIDKIMQYLPCVMHLENRVGIKILTMLLIEGLSNAAGNEIPCCNQATINQRKNSYLEKAGKIISKLLGDDVKWEVPVEKKMGSETQDIGIINMENYKIRKVIEGFDKLIELSVTDNTRKQKWKSALINYSKSIEIMQKKVRITHKLN